MPFKCESACEKHAIPILIIQYTRHLSTAFTQVFKNKCLPYSNVHLCFDVVSLTVHSMTDIEQSRNPLVEKQCTREQPTVNQ